MFGLSHVVFCFVLYLFLYRFVFFYLPFLQQDEHPYLESVDGKDFLPETTFKYHELRADFHP